VSRRPPSSLLLASTVPLPAAPAEREAPAPPRLPPTWARRRVGRPPAAPGRTGTRDPAARPPVPGRVYGALAAVALTLGALSLLAPSTPSYDPWSWNLWAREIVHGHLTITDTGTSWKPLPMIFTIPFALLGSAGPDLWLVVARAGAVAAALMAFRLAHRLTRELARARLGDEADREGWAVRAPAALAGLIALIALGFAARGGYITANGLGYSEGLATALLLVAVECHLDGRPRAAFLVGFLVALDRPEIWLFWIPYGLWLARRDPGARGLVAVAVAAQPVAWFLPVYLGSGHLGSSVARAQNPRANSLAYSSDPFLSELTRAAWPTMMMRVKLMAGLVLLAAAGLSLRARARVRAGAARPAGAAVSALDIAALLGLGGAAWFVVIALMTQLGFSGNDRYLVLGAGPVDVCAAVGFGAVAVELGRVRSRRPGRGWAGVGARAGVGIGLAAAAFALLPGWIETQDFVALPKVHGALLYQARLRQDLGAAIARAGGPRRVLACGRVMTEGFQVPMVAYALGVPTPRVLAPPASTATPGPAPDVILQTRATRSSSQLPIVRAWAPVDYTYDGASGPWHTFTHCAAGS
jgi:hypothetical protein